MHEAEPSFALNRPETDNLRADEREEVVRRARERAKRLGIPIGKATGFGTQESAPVPVPGGGSLEDVARAARLVRQAKTGQRSSDS